MLDEAAGAGVDVSIFDPSRAGGFPLVGQRDPDQDGHDPAEHLARQVGGNRDAAVVGAPACAAARARRWTVLGAVLLTVLQNGSVLLNGSGYRQRAIIGSVVLVAVFVHVVRRR